MKDWAVSLPRFQGPLDLLLSLVRRNKIGLSDLPVAEIARQYLDYLRQAGELDVNLGAEYADMAATLIHLKSRTLLPQDPELVLREPDPRQDLVRQLLDYEQMREAAGFLRQKLEIAGASYSQPSIAEFTEPPPGAPEPLAPGTLNLLDVVRLAKRALDAARLHQQIDTAPEPVTTASMIAWVERRLAAAGPDRVNALDWFEEQDSARRRVALLLALLELARRGDVSLSQPAEYGDLWVQRT